MTAPEPSLVRNGTIKSVYLVHVRDDDGPLFYVRCRPDPEIWLRPGATAADVARVYLQSMEGK